MHERSGVEIFACVNLVYEVLKGTETRFNGGEVWGVGWGAVECVRSQEEYDRSFGIVYV